MNLFGIKCHVQTALSFGRAGGHRSVGFVLTLLLPAWAAAQTGTIEGTLTNGTTGTAAQVERVLLYERGEEEELQRLEAPAGSFRFEGLDSSLIYQVVAIHQGVVYSASVALEGGSPAQADVVVYDTTRETSQLKVTLTFLLLGLHENQLVVRKRYRIENPTRFTVKDEAGPIRIDLPEHRTFHEVTVVRGRELKVVTPAPVGQGQGYWVNVPIPPGQTHFDVESRLPYDPGGQQYEERFFYAMEPFQLFAHPWTLSLEGPQVVPLGVDEELKAGRYRTLTGFQPGESLRLTVVERPEVLPPEDHVPERSTIQETPTQLGRYQVPILVTVGLVLFSAALLSLRVRRQERGAVASDVKQLEIKKQILLDAMVNLEAQKKAGLLSSRAYRKQRQQLEAQLLEVTALLKTTSLE